MVSGKVPLSGSQMAMFSLCPHMVETEQIVFFQNTVIEQALNRHSHSKKRRNRKEERSNRFQINPKPNGTIPISSQGTKTIISLDALPSHPS
jgi:hypothetical protein